MCLNGGRKITRICTRRLCGNEALWNPVLLIPSPRENVRQKPGRLFIDNQGTCDSHKASLRVVDFLGATGWEQLRLQIMKQEKDPPKEEDLVLEWVEML